MFEYNYGAQPIPYLNEFVTFKEGKLYPNDRPGLGVTVNMDRLRLVPRSPNRGRIGRPITGRTARRSRGNKCRSPPPVNKEVSCQRTTMRPPNSTVCPLRTW